MTLLANSPPAAQDTFDLDGVVSALRDVRLNWREASGRAREPAGRELPSPDTVIHIVDDLCGVLFPMRLGPPELRPLEEDFYVRRTLGQTLQFLQGQVRLELAQEARVRALAAHEQLALHEDARVISHQFARALPAIRSQLDADVAAAFKAQPDTRSIEEVLLCNPGLRALIHHRIAHQLHHLGARLIARMVADLAHTRTGIDIHPAAQIGPGCAIQHGSGLVIERHAVLAAGARLRSGLPVPTQPVRVTG